MPTQDERIRSLQSTALFQKLSNSEVADFLDKFKEEKYPGRNNSL